MDKTFHIDGDFLQEDARMEKPVPPRSDNQDEYARLYAEYNRLRYAYNQHIDSLARYPLAPRHDWPKKEGLIEDVDFEILIDVTGFAGADFAKPLRQPVAEERTFTLAEVEEIFEASREKHQPYGKGSTKLYKYSDLEQYLASISSPPQPPAHDTSNANESGR